MRRVGFHLDLLFVIGDRAGNAEEVAPPYAGLLE